MPTRPDLRSAIARDLRDPDGAVFTEPELNDLINLGIVEVSRIYPKADVIELPVAEDAQKTYDTAAYSFFRVEVLNNGQVHRGIPANNDTDTGEGGWDLHGGRLWLPFFAVGDIKAGEEFSIRAWGYWPRELLADDSQSLDGDAETEFAVRTYAVLNGYQRLQNDRILFQQWLTNTGNTDVSPNQLGQVADLYMSQWREMRNRLRSLQRT